MSLSKQELIEINEALKRIEAKLDLTLTLMQPPRPLNIKGYPAKNFDWTSKIFSYKTKGNRE